VKFFVPTLEWVANNPDIEKISEEMVKIVTQSDGAKRRHPDQRRDLSCAPGAVSRAFARDLVFGHPK